LVQHTIPTTFNSNFNEIILFQNSPVQPLIEKVRGVWMTLSHRFGRQMEQCKNNKKKNTAA
jgi:hypothetical protein